MKYCGFLKIRRKYAGTERMRVIIEAIPKGAAKLKK